MHYAVHRVLFRESIFSVYAIVVPVRPLFATSSLEYKTAGTHSDIAIGTALRRACGASCIRLVKAFETVPRELFWRVLTKLGVPDKLVSILKAMHIRMWRFSLKLMALEETQFDHRSKAGRSSRTRIVHLLYECSSRNLEIAALL